MGEATNRKLMEVSAENASKQNCWIFTKLDCFDWIHPNIQCDFHMHEGYLSMSYGYILVHYNNVLMDFW